MRKIISFDKGWRFEKGSFDDVQDIAFDDRDWQELNVPHDWSIADKFNPEMENGGRQGYRPRGEIGWYRKVFTLPSSFNGKHLTLQFDGIHQNSEVWINGHLLGQRPYGYVSFYYDITPYLKENAENIIVVKVDNTSPIFDRWYSGSGIYRHVWLIATEAVHVGNWGTYITTSSVDEAKASIHIQTELVNKSEEDVECIVLTQIKEKAGYVIVEERIPYKLAVGNSGAANQTLNIKYPKLWSPDTPNLYEVHTMVYINDILVDDYITSIGIRDVVFDNDQGLLLNGTPVKLKGVCLHHDLGSLGAAFHEQAMERRLNVLKELGCNAIRFSHNPMAPGLLALCDRMGFLVVNEAFDKWKSLSYEPIFEQWWKRDLEAMVKRDRNHACVILWSVGNEVEQQGSPEMIEILGMLVDYCRELDPSRLITCAFEPHNWPRTLFYGPIEDKVKKMQQLAEKVDILALNYQEQWYEHYREAIPNKLIVGAESFPFFRGSGNVLKAFEPNNPWFDVEKHNYVIGQFIWPGIDYLGESSYPYKGWQAGLIDTCGFRKAVSYLQESLWSEKPVVHIAVFDDTLNSALPSKWAAHWHSPKMLSSWTLPHYENQLVRLTTFTNCETVELLLNGESLGEKKLKSFPNKLMTWYVPYASGTIEAIGRNSGEIITTHQLQTAGHAQQILLKPDKDHITANETDIVHVEVSIADEQGLLVPLAEVKIDFEIKGAGRIVAIDNGNLSSDEMYQGKSRMTYFGQCLVIIQSLDQIGAIELHASAGGLQTDPIVIQVQ